MIFDTIYIMFAMICVGKLFLFFLWKELKLYHMGFLYYHDDLRTSSYHTMMQNTHHTRYILSYNNLASILYRVIPNPLKGTKILQDIITLKLISSSNTS
jgi:hypothetical protein